MRLFHVSEESSIEVFNPRTPTHSDSDKNVGLHFFTVHSYFLPEISFTKTF